MSHIVFGAVMCETAEANIDGLFGCQHRRRVVVRAPAAVLDDQVCEETARSHVAGATDYRRRRRVVRQA